MWSPHRLLTNAAATAAAGYAAAMQLIPTPP